MKEICCYNNGSRKLCFIHSKLYYNIFDYNRGSLNNYLDKKKVGGVSRKSMIGHVTKGRYHVKCPQLSTQGGRGGQSWVKNGPRSS